MPSHATMLLEASAQTRMQGVAVRELTHVTRRQSRLICEEFLRVWSALSRSAPAIRFRFEARCVHRYAVAVIQPGGAREILVQGLALPTAVRLKELFEGPGDAIVVEDGPDAAETDDPP